MDRFTRIAWSLGNRVAQLVFAFRHGYRSGYGLRPGAQPKIFKE